MEGWEIFIRNGGEARNRWEGGGEGEGGLLSNGGWKTLPI